MARNRSAMFTSFLKLACIALLLLGTEVAATAHAAELPLALGSPLAGFEFDDRPLSLPVQRNFQMAMLTVSSELGRSCNKMEAYGWRLKQNEQRRVNTVFDSTVDRLRGLGYIVETQTPTSVSRDITVFTADRPDKHFIFMWSAGEIGLAMVLCQTSAPLAAHNAPVTQIGPAVETFPQAVDAAAIHSHAKPRRKVDETKFSPVGDWVGGYTCAQGYTGGTLQIAHLNGENFDGIFRFYPTPKNPYVPTGRYTVYGQYDRESHRILITPGKWLERPKDYYNTMMVGAFDPNTRTFSAYFQGITGCTSFEAHYGVEDYVGYSKDWQKPAVSQSKKTAKKKTAVKKKMPTPSVVVMPPPTPEVKPAVEVMPAPTSTVPTAPAPAAITPAVAVPTPAATSAPAVTPTPQPVAAPVDAMPQPAAPTPTVVPPPNPPAPAAITVMPSTPPASAPTSAAPSPVVTPGTDNAPSSIELPAPPANDAPVPLTMPEQTPAPAQVAPPPQIPAPLPTAPPPQISPSPQTTPDQTKPSGALQTKPKLIQLADAQIPQSGQYFYPTSPIAPPAPTVQPVQIAPPAQTAPPVEITLPTPVAPIYPPTAQINTVTTPAPTVPEPPQVLPPTPAIPVQTAPDAVTFLPSPTPVPPPEQVPYYKPY